MVMPDFVCVVNERPSVNEKLVRLPLTSVGAMNGDEALDAPTAPRTTRSPPWAYWTDSYLSDVAERQLVLPML